MSRRRLAFLLKGAVAREREKSASQMVHFEHLNEVAKYDLIVRRIRVDEWNNWSGIKQAFVEGHANFDCRAAAHLCPEGKYKLDQAARWCVLQAARAALVFPSACNHIVV